ncbi:hypothetical protein A3757_24830 [Oleiphilus sp. HI0117]|nr:hypothetical protein A3757_24830 [Oleiphilus sp. HI0117]
MIPEAYKLEILTQRRNMISAVLLALLRVQGKVVAIKAQYHGSGKHNKARQHRSLRSLDLVSLGRCWRRYSRNGDL